ncbi:MAG: polymer-forming cytoskeletal protein [Acidobacteria bacterium]|nr:polymer-forming cytoskeletal protein [Acidobacteriota bacterium]MCA1640997.1 polymer-forming cytoskeletal protein [Acidobacteriota bacterium]
MGRGNRNEPAAGAQPVAQPTTQPTAPPGAQPTPQQSAPPAQSRDAQPAPRGVPAAAVAPPPPQQQQSQPARAVSETDALARGMKDGGVGGFVGGTSTLSGEINFKGMMRVDGRLSGRVNSSDGTLIVSSGGKVEAQIAVAVAKINGTVEGDITATERIELGRTARVSGNLQTPALVVEEGAIFEGGCRMTSAAAPARTRHAA